MLKSGGEKDTCGQGGQRMLWLEAWAEFGLTGYKHRNGQGW